MKTRTSIIFALCLLASVNSCEKVQVKDPCQDISGQWLWLSTWYIYYQNPKTPQNSGINEILKFNPDKTWLRIQNHVLVESGTYSTGHGSYLPYVGAYNYIYDSIIYYKNGKEETYDYYKIFNDTLQFSNMFADLTGGGSIFYIKQK